MKLESTVLFAYFFVSFCTAANLTAAYIVSHNDTQVNGTYKIVNQIKIVGGQPARPNEFPSLVNIRIGNIFCGGSLIELDLVLTAAHCVYNQTAKSITVRAGDHNIYIAEPTEQVADAQAVKWHENYKPGNENDDIAVIRLAKNLTLTKAVQPIALPPTSLPLNPSVNGTVVGWGHTSYQGSMSNVVQKISIPLWNQIDCGNAYTSFGSKITDTQFCAGSPGKDSCQGDSGGPFLCNNATVVCGIVSFGYECARPQYPGVYTRVPSYISWINANRNISFTPSFDKPSSPKPFLPTTTRRPSSSTSASISTILFYISLIVYLKKYFY